MKNLKVRTKLSMLLAAMIIAMVALVAMSISGMNGIQTSAVSTITESISQDYDDQIRNEVETAISICEMYNQLTQSGMTIEEAKEYSATVIRGIRYGEAGYLWVDTYDGDNVVLLGNDTEGTNRLGAKDSQGFAMVADFIEGAKKNPETGYFNEYYFPKEGETVASPKRAYTKVYEPFQWVIGTGNYIDYIETTTAKHETTLQNKATNIGILSISVGIVLIIIAIVLTVMITRSIVNPLKDTSVWLDEMGGGDFSRHIEPKYENQTDDFGNLMQQLEKTRHSVSKLLKGAKNNSATVNNSSIELAHGAAQTKDNSANITIAVSEIADGATNQAESVQDGVNAIQEILSNVETLNTEVDAADEKATAMAESSDNMQANFEKLKDAMTQSANSLLDVSEKVKAMGDSVEEVQNAVAAINEISSRTNLLSLNASIEAARAGEAGKGFAVVATEIQDLSVQSSQSAQRIGEIMKGLLDSSESAVSTVSQLNEAVSGQQQISDETADAVRDVINMIADVRENFSKAKDAAELTRTKCVDLNDTMSSLSAISEENAASAQETSASMQEVNNTVENISDLSATLENVSNELTALLEVFRVSDL
ncbi:methyl-accepting chemotaxis sensory transducer with Cache sensor [Butyrivibrio fibrisolvens DSM 3071]|uniref:Methyl-accepting chemotaxis sensory transducer with Cache sensor n=1 Tax=Butyrivibrio fibrisolvens DSM 3071 TaxID=1121131 RepID=A0A1M6AHT9_BUTFI|nr:methyl-accepting chemotaxis protein [Butyrivibrio fibrisolvens]SHI36066.1 methyl-accepting chemotaxis sensory transducer with Cache sensor [Butyrivibrio fibrisolvens DSM 3071]